MGSLSLTRNNGDLDIVKYVPDRVVHSQIYFTHTTSFTELEKIE